MPSTQRRRILIVDDSVDNLFLLQTALQFEGYDVETASNGSLALACIEASAPDLVLLDVMMPGMSGYEVTQCIRQNHKLPFIPILFVSAYDEEGVAKEFDLKADDFIRKPINFDKLLTRIRAFWS